MIAISRPLLTATLLAALSADAAAQSAPAGLRQRMDGFLAALRSEAPLSTIRGFFPRDSAWELVRVPDSRSPYARVLTFRVAADSTFATISEGGRACDSFGGVFGGEVGPIETTMGMQARIHRRPWRYLGRLRFVPPGEPATSSTYVEWRRERGTWVLSRAGELYYYSSPVLGESASYLASRDTTAGNGLPLERRLAAGTQWFRDSEPIFVANSRYTKYGLPRPLPDSLLVRYGSVGTVPVYVERGVASRYVGEVIYVLVNPGEYQPYQGIGHGSICRTALAPRTSSSARAVE